MAKYKALDIAEWFIARNQKSVEQQGGEKITLLKLLKLLYYAEGCFLALNCGSLFDEKIIAWEHGPVVVEVYDRYCKDAYNLDIPDCEKALSKINEFDSNILEQVFSIFGQYSAWALREKTHTEDPWLEATDNGSILKREINRETMKKYFMDNYVS